MYRKEPECPCRKRCECRCECRKERGCIRPTATDDPLDQGGIPNVVDPIDQGGIPNVVDPMDQGGIPNVVDPLDQGGIPNVVDPSSCRARCIEPPRDRSVCGGRPGRDPSGWIVVRLAPDLPPIGADSLLDLAVDLKLDGLVEVLRKFELEASRRLITQTDVKYVLELERAAAQSQLPPLRSLTSYWRLDVRRQSAKAEKIVKRLRVLHEVDVAYRELAATDPAVSAFDDPYASCQGYLDAAPTGIDARWAWHHTNGADVGFADLEQGWILGHEDLNSPQMAHGDNRDGVGTYRGNHGTAVLGEVLATDSTFGVVGIAPGVRSVRLLSHFDLASGVNGWVADAILAAISELAAGDVLLLEVQRAFLPTEVDDADFDAIRLAVASGLVVVEAAGNGGTSLDAWADPVAGRILGRCSCAFRDSGAVIVGCALSDLPHDRKAASNYGSRVDAFAWGDQVVSCGYGDLDPGAGPHESYTADFANTSAASPIVAGAALLVQSRYQAVTGRRLSPLQMRAVLSDPATGTPQGGGVAGAIGVMPDLRAIFHRLGLVPAAFLRDGACEPQTPRAGRFTSASPDLALRPAAAKPSAGFEAGVLAAIGGTEDHHVLLRITNDGRGTAEGVRATVYWSELATLLTPDLWRRIGTTEPLDVPQGGVPRTARPVTWKAENLPPGGRCALIAVLDDPVGDEASAEDGATSSPIPGLRRGRLQDAFDWHEFQTFLGDRRLAVCNVQAVDPRVSIEDALELPFLVTGTPRGDRLRSFDFELVQQVPDGVRLALDVPPLLSAELRRGRSLPGEPSFLSRGGTRIARIAVPALPRAAYCDVHLCAGARHRAWLRVEGHGLSDLGPDHEIAIRQLYAGREVGRIVWRFCG